MLFYVFFSIVVLLLYYILIMKLQQYYIHQDNYKQHTLFDETIHFIKKSFWEIAHMYNEDNIFKNRIQWDLKQDILSDKDLQIFYILQNTKDKIIWCLWWVIYEDTIEEKPTNFFLSSYVSINKEYRNQQLWTLLKTKFEELANEKRQETKQNTIVWSCVHKKNIPSQQRNITNWYITKNHGNQSTDSEYIKYYKGDYI